MALQVTKTGEVIVRLPFTASYRLGHELVLKNSRWVYEAVLKIRSRPVLNQFSWADGSELLLFGEKRIIRILHDVRRKGILIKESSEELTLTGSIDGEDTVRSVIKNWYRQRARQYLEEKTAFWAQIMNTDYGRIAIRDQATRWGSCSGKGNLNFNWRLVLLPEDLADYVVVHELAHRTYMNHSKAFWSTVEKEIPDYRSRRKRLREYESDIYQKY
ncbi:M48 family metallopeptidase [Bacteroides xylanolyticus]|uniref:M48 family metallopeptidase n=2 Tax=Lacrimispora defluvii TaxID=2719233 RepID=A0ABX1VYH7_9FIRM|nr:M48 family metallopeptidase [Lacrimispora defluvii]